MADRTDRGVVLTETGRFGLEEIVLDEPGLDEVIVRIEATGVCHSDLHAVETPGERVPLLLGHEAAGMVEQVGENVTNVERGERVILGWRSPCGRCRSPVVA